MEDTEGHASLPLPCEHHVLFSLAPTSLRQVPGWINANKDLLWISGVWEELELGMCSVGRVLVWCRRSCAVTLQSLLDAYCGPSTQKVEARGLGVQGYPQIHSNSL